MIFPYKAGKGGIKSETFLEDKKKQSDINYFLFGVAFLIILIVYEGSLIDTCIMISCFYD